MRELKFRAWSGGMGEPFNLYDELTGPLEQHSMWLEDTIFMQYTGLKDKNGTEIYEGDILNITTTFHTYPMPVIWDEDRWTFTDDATYGTLSEWNETSEIIGNIYENPEMVK